jgi:hypothetical protein
VLLARQIGGKCRDRRRNGAGTLQHATGDDDVDVVGEGRDETAADEQQQTEDDHRLAPETVGSRTVGNLQAGLRQPVGTESHADERHVVAGRQLLGIKRKDRQDQEEAQHAQGKNSRQADAGASFFAAHAVGTRGGHEVCCRAAELRILAGLPRRLRPAPQWKRYERSRIAFAAHARTT